MADKFERYEIAPCKEVPGNDGAVETCTVEEAEFWSIYGWHPSTLTVWIADRDDYLEICQLYTLLTGHVAPIDPGHYTALKA
jgi:hypothetical protein